MPTKAAQLLLPCGLVEGGSAPHVRCKMAGVTLPKKRVLVCACALNVCIMWCVLCSAVEGGSSPFCGFFLLWELLVLLLSVACGRTAPPVCCGTNWKTGSLSAEHRTAWGWPGRGTQGHSTDGARTQPGRAGAQQGWRTAGWQQGGSRVAAGWQQGGSRVAAGWQQGGSRVAAATSKHQAPRAYFTMSSPRLMTYVGVP